MTVNPHYIPRLFTLSRCHKRCSLDRDSDRMQMTHFSFYDHDATQSERAGLDCKRVALFLLYNMIDRWAFNKYLFLHEYFLLLITH